MKTDYFEYPVPYNSELRELYQSPYRFSDDMREVVDRLFLHPYNKYNTLYENLHYEFDSNDMLKPAYLISRYFNDHPNQFAGSMDNIAPMMIVRMWKCFLSLHKHVRGQVFTQYYPAKMKLLMVGNGMFLDQLQAEIGGGKIIMSGDDMVEVREGKELREQNAASMLEGGKHFEYLCSLE